MKDLVSSLDLDTHLECLEIFSMNKDSKLYYHLFTSAVVCVCVLIYTYINGPASSFPV